MRPSLSLSPSPASPRAEADDEPVHAAPIDTASPDCQVAYSLENGGGSNATSFLQSTVALDIVSSLSKGWYVSVPDHEGSNASFISGVTEGLAGIDGLRALLNHNETIPSTDNYSAVIHGYSGGGHASAWTTQFLSTYGEGLNVRPLSPSLRRRDPS